MGGPLSGFSLVNGKAATNTPFLMRGTATTACTSMDKNDFFTSAPYCIASISSMTRVSPFFNTSEGGPKTEKGKRPVIFRTDLLE
ncbi:MAG: hypothetical protein EOO01_31670 [Chitinophagaceae bacterium]|nr:MAG: hypothetical protein EOO01_31670 [Chitinophagaceae bacterium]